MADLALLTSFPPTFPLLPTTSVRLVLEAFYRRITTDPASEAGRRLYESQCRDVRELLGSRFERAILATWEHDLAEMGRLDERVSAAVCTLTATDRKTLVLRAELTLADGATRASLVLPITSDLIPEITING